MPCDTGWSIPPCALLPAPQEESLILDSLFRGAGFGALPDLIGAYGNNVIHDRWMLYNKAHFGPIASVLQYVQMYEFHLFIDSFTHGHGKRWWIWNERLWVEILLWVVNGVVIWWMITLWQRRRQISGESEQA